MVVNYKHKIIESYFTFFHSDKNSNAGFWPSDVGSVSNNGKFKTEAKFEKKLLVLFEKSRYNCYAVYDL
jgi:hypothetical protein